jgi:sugar/nucleoside kinase (ribokinase family)
VRTGRYDLLCVGDLNVDIIFSGIERLPELGTEVLTEDLSLRVGGSTANVAAFAAQLGLNVALVARVGNDPYGDFALEGMRALGVDVGHVRRDPTLKTGATAALSTTEDRAFVTYVGTIAGVRAEDVSAEVLQSARHIHVGSFFLQDRLRPDLPRLLADARTGGLTVSLDPGFDPRDRWDAGLIEVLGLVDVFLPNEIEAMQITERGAIPEAGKVLAERCPLVAIKAGAEGAWGFRGEEMVHLLPPDVEVVETTCCGDAFNAGFLFAFLQGKPLQQCLAAGNLCGSAMATAPGNQATLLASESIRAGLSEMLAGPSGRAARRARRGRGSH